MKTTKNALTFLSILTILSCTTVSAQTPQGKDYNYKKLFELVWKGDSKNINTLLSNGYDVNQTDKIGNTALMLASRIGDKLVLEALLSHNCDVNKANSLGITALMIAGKYDNAHVVDMLMQKGADPLFTSIKGYKASTFAYGFKHYPLYEKLIDAERKAEKALKKQKQ